MQLVCPSCAAAYSVPDALIGQGRNMRCVRCQHDWFAAPPAGAAEAVAVPPPAPVMPIHAMPTKAKHDAPAARATQKAAPKPANRASPLLAMAWVASIGLVAGGVWAVWAYRRPLAEFWPPLTRLYALLGA